MASKHNRQRRSDKHQAYVRDDEYAGDGGTYTDAGYAYDRTAVDAGMMPGGAGVAGKKAAGTSAMPSSRVQAAGGSGVGTDSRNRSQSRGGSTMHNNMHSSSTNNNSNSNSNSNSNNSNMNARSPSSPASTKDNIQHRRCKDEKCGQPIAWRNAEDVFVGSRGLEGVVNHNTNTSLNASGSLGPMHANQDDRDYLMKLMGMLSVTGLPLPDLASATGFAGGVLPSFDATAGAELPQKRTRAWECARYAVERDRREFFYCNRAPTQNVILSPWCQTHTCRYFFSREQCLFKKIQFDTVCNTHTTCPVPNCATAKTQMIDRQQSDQRAITWVRDEFCQTHGCSADGCGLRCDQADNQADLRFCPSHRCYYRGCNKQGQPGRGFCSKHKCQSHGCSTLSLAGFELCKKHVACAQNKCPKPRHVINVADIPIQKDCADCGIEYYDRKAYLLYCSDHAFCGASPPCRLLRKTPAIYCFKHVCSETGCSIAASEDVKFCNKHRCGQPTCIQPKAWKDDRKRREDFCLGHLCRANNCGQGVGDNRLYCVGHECGITGCTSRDTGGSFCVNHAHVHSQKKGESDAHAKAERLARVLQPARAAPDYHAGIYPVPGPGPGLLLSSFASLYGADSSATSRSSHSRKSSRSAHHQGRYPSTSTTRGRKRNAGTPYAASFGNERDDSGEEDTGDSAGESVHSRRHRDARETHGRSGPVLGPAFGAGAGVRPQVSQQQPPVAPGGPNGGPVRPMPVNGARPMGKMNGPGPGGPGSPGPGQNGVRRPPPSMSNYQSDISDD